MGSTLVLGTGVRSFHGWDRILATGFAALIFIPYFLSEFQPLRLIAILILCAAMFYEASIRSRANGITALYVLVAALAVLMLFGQMRLAGNDSFQVERLFFIFPVAFWLGVLVYRNQRMRTWARVIVIVGLLNAVFAIREDAAGHSIVGRELDFVRFERDGGVRALLASDHPLVLGACIAACVPLLAVAAMPGRRVMAVILLAGTWSTGSRGPTIIAAVVAITLLLPGAAAWLSKRANLVRGLIAIGFIVLGYLGLFVFSSTVNGQTALEYSAGYRYALYALLPKLLASHPIGYGLRGIPENTVLISRPSGVVDVSVTVDSELVGLVAVAGVLGLGLYLLAVKVATAAIAVDTYVGLTATAITLAGLFVALSAWDSLGPMWCWSLGAAWAARRQSKRDPKHLISASQPVVVQ